MLRPATQSDIPAIKTLLQSEPGFWRDNWREDVLARGIEAAGGLAFVWEESGQILGFACAHDLGFRAYLSELIVAEPARNKDIGTSLIRHIEQELERRGCAVLFSDVWTTAVGFYKSLGWSEPDVVLLRKRLGQRPNGQK